MRRVYMDANATTPLVPEVLDAMRPYFIEHFGNASSIHQQGQQARAAVEQARESVAALINCRAAEIVFTSGGTESDNLALFGLVQPGDHLITSSIEHHAVLHAAEKLRDRGIEVTFLPVSGEGVVNPIDLRRAIQANTKLISIMMANNETGAIQPVSEIGRIAAEADIYFHTDAVQAAGKLPIDVQSLRCDLLSISGHKMHAPQGTGILYVRRGTQLEPLFFGGTHERQRRAGTENLPGIVGLGKAAEIARTALSDGTVERVAALRNRFEQGILLRLKTRASTAETWLAFPTLPTSTSTTSKAKHSSSLSTSRACAPPADQPAPPVLPNHRTFSPRWRSARQERAPACASALPSSTPKRTLTLRWKSFPRLRAVCANWLR